MTDPVLHVLAGPNGAGKTTLYERVIGPTTHLEFVNADRIASETWPGEEVEHGYDAAARAAEARDRLLVERRSIVTETVFSHPSKVDLVAAARRAGYQITIHVVLIPADLAVLRVQERVLRGGHDVPESKIVDRWKRLWRHVADAVPAADEVIVYDNSEAKRPYRIVARFRNGRAVVPPDWPAWTPDALRALTS